MEQYYWDEQVDYLMDSRYMFFNDDYLEFLIKRVWKFSKPIHIVDYGCGLGYIGMKFLHHLPEGSRYTGIDKGEKLISKAREIFNRLPFETEFIVADVNDLNVKEQQYDVATCQALLLHLPNPKEMLNKMIRSVKQGGQLICIEPHWISAMANSYVDEIEQSKIVNLGILQKLFEMDQKRTGKDGNIGIKLPVYMRELGLKNIGSRVSDCVRYLHPDAEDKEKLFKVICDEGFSAPVLNEEVFINQLVNRGISLDEANLQLDSEKYLHSEFSQNGLFYNSVFASTMMISYGTK